MRTVGHGRPNMDNDHPPPSDDVFELLDNSRRRLLLRYLFDSGGEADLDELSRMITDHETDAPWRMFDGETANVYQSLHETHVPKLAERGVVEYDETERVVSLGSRADEVATVLSDPQERRRRWAAGYLLVAVCLGGVVFANESNLVFVPPVVVSATTVGGAATFLSIAGLQYYRTRSRGGNRPPLNGPIN